MKKRMITLLMAGMVVVTLAGCGTKVESTADTMKMETEQVQLVETVEQTVELTEQAAEKTIEVKQQEVVVAEEVHSEAEQITDTSIETELEIVEETVEANDDQLIIDLQDMIINYKDRVDRTKSSYGSIPVQYKFADINNDEYPELFTMSDGGVITVFSYYNGDVWDTFDSAQAGGDWFSSANKVYYNPGESKIRAYKNDANHYEENFLYEYVIGEHGPSIKCIKYTTTSNDNYRVGTEFSNTIDATRAEYERFLDGMNGDYEVCLSGSINDGYFTIDEAFEAYMNGDR